MHTPAGLSFLEDANGAFAVIVVGDAAGRPQWTTVSYAQGVADRIVQAVHMPEEQRTQARRMIARHCSADPNAAGIDIMGAGGKQIAQWMALGLDAAPDGEPVCATPNWYLHVNACWSSNIDGLAFALVHDAPRNRFLAALVDGRDGLPTRYRTVAAWLHETKKDTHDFRVDRNVLLLPEAMAGVCALGYATQKRAETERLWLITCLKNGGRHLVVLVYKNADGPCGLRFTDNAARLRAWIRAAPNLDQNDRRDALDLADQACQENGRHACILGGQGGGEAALAFVVGANITSLDLSPAHGPPLTVHVPVSVAGRSGKALVLHSSERPSDSSAALVPDDPRTHERYLKTAVLGDESVRIPDCLARTLAIGFRQYAASVD